jgi:hypothetical protein
MPHVLLLLRHLVHGLLAQCIPGARLLGSNRHAPFAIPLLFGCLGVVCGVGLVGRGALLLLLHVSGGLLGASSRLSVLPNLALPMLLLLVVPRI